jgi:D-glycero-alpha-D-manno-heptose 1-phosphate guanylyltransferase
VLIKSAIILAGGMGTRLRSAVPDIPKPMAPINNKPFLEYQLDYWIGQGIQRFILSVGYKRDIIISHFGTKYKNAFIEYVEEVEPLGTGGGLLLAARNENLPLLVLNGDTFFRVKLSDIVEYHCAMHSDWTFALFRSNEEGRYMGVQLDSKGKIFSLTSASNEIGCQANGGIYVVNPDIFNKSIFLPGQKCSLEDELVPDLLASGQSVYGFPIQGEFIDIGVPIDYYRAAEILIR